MKRFKELVRAFTLMSKGRQKGKGLRGDELMWKQACLGCEVWRMAGKFSGWGLTCKAWVSGEGGGDLVRSVLDQE